MSAVTYETETPPMARQIATLLIAGAAALLAFDFFGQVLSPAFGFARLAPVGLAEATLNAIFGSGSKPGAEALHFFAGLVGYPLGWVILNALRERVLPKLHWMIAAIGYGVFLWAFALYGMAHLVAGLPAFLGWTGITWVALWGHILFAVVAAAVFHIRRS